MTTKTCTKCGVEKELNDFYKDKTKKTGLTSHCKECKKKYYQKPEVRDRQKKYQSEWHKHNYDPSYHRNRYKNDQEYRKRCNANSKKWYEQNKKQASDYNKKYNQRLSDIEKQERKKRKSEYMKNRYKNDAEYREKIKQRSRDQIHKNKKEYYKKITEYNRKRYNSDPEFREKRKSYDSYIAYLLKLQSNGVLNKTDFSQKIIRLKRQSLKLKRLIKQKKDD